MNGEGPVETPQHRWDLYTPALRSKTGRCHYP
jgi:hypothetical protein